MLIKNWQNKRDVRLHCTRVQQCSGLIVQSQSGHNESTKKKKHAYINIAIVLYIRVCMQLSLLAISLVMNLSTSSNVPTIYSDSKKNGFWLSNLMLFNDQPKVSYKRNGNARLCFSVYAMNCN